MDSLRRKPLPRPTLASEAPPPRMPVPDRPAPIVPLPPVPDVPSRLAYAPAKRPAGTLPAPSKKRWLAIVLGLFLIGFLGSLVFLVWKADRTAQKIVIINDRSARHGAFGSIGGIVSGLFSREHTPLRSEDDGRINVLLLGRAGEKYPGRNLTDTIMIMSLDLEQDRVALLSLPRDLHTEVADTGFYTKLNSIYQFGLSNGGSVEPVRRTVEEITGLELHYLFMIDFDGFVRAIDAIGGITVDVPRDFYDARYPGPNYSYETFELKKGWQKLDGATTLKYVRERHADPEGDFGRAKRQQQVMQAVKNKALSVGTLANPFAVSRLLDVLGESVLTDVQPEEIESFFALSKRLDTQNISTAVVDAWKRGSLLKVSHIQVGPTRMFVLVPRTGDWSEVRELAEHIFDRQMLERRQNEMAAEAAVIAIADHSGLSGAGARVKSLLQSELGFREVTLLPSESGTAVEDATLLVDRSGRTKLYTLDELVKRLGLPEPRDTAFDLPADGRYEADIVLVLGRDAERILDEEQAGEEARTALENDFQEVVPAVRLEE